MNTDVTGVYLLHFDTPIAHAKHYMGMARDIQARTNKHARGTSKARIMDVLFTRNIGFLIARVWVCDTLKEAYELERRLKRAGGKSRMCPICKEQA
jgi:predicted GIY-YIG superfamily endonuclease